MDLIFATNNQHKLEEVQQLVGAKFHLKSLVDVGCVDDIPETGNTFKENAHQKSRYIFEHYNQNCFADDSGLEVEALNNEPGVYSARYSGTRNTTQNLNLVLDKLGNNKNRKARFVTVISLIIAGEEYFFEGTIEGHITAAPSGSDGFGYDPIFIPNGYDVTFAEMDIQNKNQISHRARAVQQLIHFLSEL